MNLYEIALPERDNSCGQLAEAHWLWRKAALDLAGGYTERPTGYGFWRDNGGMVFEDRMVSYRVACEPDVWAKLVAKAFDLFPDQVAIFHAQLGTATIEYRKTEAAHA